MDGRTRCVAKASGCPSAKELVKFNWGDGRTLASLGQDKTIRLWHAPTRRELFKLSRSDQPLSWLQFASSQTLLVGVLPGEHATSEVLVLDAAQ